MIFGGLHNGFFRRNSSVCSTSFALAVLSASRGNKTLPNCHSVVAVAYNATTWTDGPRPSDSTFQRSQSPFGRSGRSQTGREPPSYVLPAIHIEAALVNEARLDVRLKNFRLQLAGRGKRALPQWGASDEANSGLQRLCNSSSGKWKANHMSFLTERMHAKNLN